MRSSKQSDIANNERTNAWLDGSKALLVRYEVKLKTWTAEHFMAFAILVIIKTYKG